MNQPEEDTRSLPAVVIHSVILALSAIVALMGNSLVCLAFYRNIRLRTITNVYVLSLAVADITAATFVLPFSAIASGYRAWPFNFAFCQFSGLAAYSWGTMSINILALTAVNRYICIVKTCSLSNSVYNEENTFFDPFRSAAYTLTALLTATFATPISFQWYPLGLAIEVTGLEVRAGVSKSSIGLVGLVMPLIIFCYGSVYRTIKGHNSVLSPSTRHHKSSESKPARDTSISGSPGGSNRIWSLLDSPNSCADS